MTKHKSHPNGENFNKMTERIEIKEKDIRISEGIILSINPVIEISWSDPRKCEQLKSQIFSDYKKAKKYDELFKGIEEANKNLNSIRQNHEIVNHLDKCNECQQYGYGQCEEYGKIRDGK